MDTCAYEPTFYTNLHSYPKPAKFLAPLSRRSFCVDIDNSVIRYYFGSILFYYYYYYIFIMFTQVLVTWSLLLLCVVVGKVDLCAYEDRHRVNYFCLILNQREL